MIYYKHIQVAIIIHIKKGYRRGISAGCIQPILFGTFSKSRNTIFYSVIDEQLIASGFIGTVA